MSTINLLATPSLHPVHIAATPAPNAGDAIVLFADKSGKLLPVSHDLVAELYLDDIAEALSATGFKGTLGDMLHCAVKSKGGIRPVAVVGVGDVKKLNPQSTRKLGGIISKHLSKHKTKTALVAMEAFVKGTPESVRNLLVGMQTATYEMTDLKTDRKPTKPAALYLMGGHLNAAELTPLAAEVAAVVGGAHLTRRLIDLPPDVVTTQSLKEAAEAVAKQHKAIKATVLDRKAMQKLGMNLLLAVAQGSDQAPYVVQLSYTGNKKGKVVDLVGKGLVYDTGGLNIKYGDYMAGMKTDMAGAATVLGIVQAAAAIGAPINLRATLVIVENAVGPAAVKPDEVRTAYNGTTVEITDTDAEGRLVLYDALAWVKDQGAETILDFATLTGSIVAALGNEFAGLFCNDGTMAHNILNMAKANGEGLWAMPLTDATYYEEALTSKVADLRNWQQRDIPDSMGAALFLQLAVKTHK